MWVWDPLTYHAMNGHVSPYMHEMVEVDDLPPPPADATRAQRLTYLLRDLIFLGFVVYGFWALSV